MSILINYKYYQCPLEDIKQCFFIVFLIFIDNHKLRLINNLIQNQIKKVFVNLFKKTIKLNYIKIDIINIKIF